MNKYGRKLLTLTTLLTFATGIIHVANRFVNVTSQLKDMLDVSRRKFYDWRFGKVYYTKAGTGSPILLIHDVAPGASGYEWHKVEKELATEHTVYTIDLIGCGRSDKPGITYTNFLYVQMLCDFIKNVIGEKTDVIASGFSCSFVTMVCNYDKDCFNKVMFVNPPSLKSLKCTPSDKDKFLKFFLEIPVFGTLIYHMIVSRETISNYLIENAYYNPFHVDESMIDTYYEAAHKGGYFAKFHYSCYAAKYMNINIDKALEKIDNSVYIVEGEAEPNGNFIVSDYQSINPSIESYMIPETRHLPHMENAEHFLEQVAAFF
jgi:pimeloyl-ACP methyl ester carboxylesterase